MAAFEFTPAQSVSAGFAGRIGTVFASAFGAFKAWNDARETRNALSKLSDRELDDIGLIRGDFEAL